MIVPREAPAAGKLTGATDESIAESLSANDTTANNLLAGCDDVLDTKEIGAVLKIKPATVRELCRQGKLRSLRVGNQYRVAKIWLEAYIFGGGSQ